MTSRALKILAAFALSLACLPALAQQKECAMVLMHGKWGNTQYISFFGRRISSVCEFKSIEMPWSQRRSYDQPYPVAINEIAEQVREFRQQGYKRVVLAGHSFGANASLAYMATRDDVDALVALAPGHAPRFMYERGMNRESLEKARALVSGGKGDETLTLNDLNQGRERSMRVSANALLSYFDPAGLADMPTAARSFRKPVPLLMVVGTRDPIFGFAEAGIFAKAPQHPYSKYLVVEADHGSTPEAAVQQVSEWLKGLP